jgi:hypothetical protein
MNLVIGSMIIVVSCFYSVRVDASGAVQAQRAAQQRQQQAVQEQAVQQMMQQQQTAQQQIQQQRRAAAQQQQAYQQSAQQRAPQQFPQQNQDPSWPQSRQLESGQRGLIPNENLVPSSNDEIMDIRQVWNELERSSLIWLEIVEQEPKEITIAEYMDLFRSQGVMLRKPPTYYAQLIDTMFAENQDLTQRPFPEVLKLAAILEYDYDVGVDRDVLARQFLGEQLYQQNKQRLGLQ